MIGLNSTQFPNIEIPRAYLGQRGKLWRPKCHDCVNILILYLITPSPA
jgi:hypothetical protein